MSAAPAVAPWSVLTVGARGGYATTPLSEGEHLVGRDARCTVQLEDAVVPPIAARLSVRADAVELEVLAVGMMVDGRAADVGSLHRMRAGATFHVGPVLFALQPRRPNSARRLWTHGSFEMRLEEECLRAEIRQQTFVLVRLRLVDPTASRKAEEVLSNELRLTDVLGVYGPGQYEALLPETSPTDGAMVAARVEARLTEAGVRCRFGRASFPTDGWGADELAEVASRGTRGEERESADSVVMAQSFGLREAIGRVAASSLPVLILGETGAGKERAAELVHELSPRKGRPFLRLNCAALTESLLESELFGYERGAFTGAVGSKPGLLQTADTGTVFLDEVGELPPAIQAKLLRVIEERQVLRLGGLKPIGIDVRFVSATNRNLEAEVARGTFRIDLYYRIAGVQVWVPPLRERLDELPALAETLLRNVCEREHMATVPRLSAEALELMRRYPWPGNVRELRNVLERAVLLVTGEEILRDHLPVEKMLASFAARRVAPPSVHNTRTGTRGTGSNPRGVTTPADVRTPAPARAPAGTPAAPSAGDAARASAPTPQPGGYSSSGSSVQPGGYDSAGSSVQSAGYAGTGSAVQPAGYAASAPGGAVAPGGGPAPRPGEAEPDLKASVRELERRRIQQALEACAGNQTAAAKLLGISRRTLVARLAEFGFPRPRKPRGPGSGVG